MQFRRPNFLASLVPFFQKRAFCYRPITKEDRKLPNVVSGPKLAKKLQKKLKEFIDTNSNSETGRPGVAFFLVGDRHDSRVYIRKKSEACTDLGINHFTYQFPDNIDEATILNAIDEINSRNDIHGLIVQLPLPESLSSATHRIINHVLPAKDVDGISDRSITSLLANYKQALNIPCTPAACLYILKEHGIQLQGKHCVVINRSRVVGLPLWQMLLQEDATVTVCHSYTKNMAEILSEADIIFSAIGRPHNIKSEWIKPGAVVLDIGTTFVRYEGEQKITGDIHFHEVVHKAGLITPVPGGVGPLTVSMLIKNVIKSWARTNNIKFDVE